MADKRSDHLRPWFMVRRICVLCGHMFGIEHRFGHTMPDHCPNCPELGRVNGR